MVDIKYNIRGIVGKGLTERDIKYFAKSVVEYIYKNNEILSVVIAKDNRLSGDYVLSVLQSELLKCGIGVYMLGVATTPALANITKQFRFSAGIMITASHNSYEYNGLKIFDKNGNVLRLCSDKKVCGLKKFGQVVDAKNFKELYIQELKHALGKNRTDCIFDCANGASTEIVREVFKGCQMIGTELSGKYINNGFGTENIDKLKSYCKRNNKIGFAFDGDADRVVAVDLDGEIIDGDKILYILATQKLRTGDKVVGTQLSSLALERALDRFGIELVRAKVGAKFVASKMQELDVKLGAEACGHVFDDVEYSDGVRVAIELINIINRTGKSFKQLLEGYESTYKFYKDIYIESDEKVLENDSVEDNVHVVVRKSLTEPKIRIFVEGFDKCKAQQKFEQIVDRVK